MYSEKRRIVIICPASPLRPCLWLRVLSASFLFTSFLFLVHVTSFWLKSIAGLSKFLGSFVSMLRMYTIFLKRYISIQFEHYKGKKVISVFLLNLLLNIALWLNERILIWRNNLSGSKMLMSRQTFIKVKDIIIEDKQYFNTIFKISEWSKKKYTSTLKIK